jgi:UDP-glucose 4-epimerase
MDLAGKKIVVIGGAGLIGSHVVDCLLETEVREIVVYDNFFRGSLENLSEALKDERVSVFPHGGDINYPDILEAALEGADGVFHLAALWILQCEEYPDTAFKVNVQGTFNVAQACIKAGVKRLVYSSSASVYGDALETPMTEDHTYNNWTLYGATKIAGEHLLKALGKRYGLEWVGLRYMNVYGPRQDYKGAYTAVMHKILDRIESGKPPCIYGDGSQMYDFIHVHDIARANILAMQAETTAECYNVGRGIGTTINELAQLLLDLTGTDLELERLPAGKSFVTHRVGCPKKAQEDLGYTWSIELEEGMKSLIEWRKQDQAGLAAKQRKMGGVGHEA